MNGELAQIIALILYGNEYLSSHEKSVPELLTSHSTFQFVSDLTFEKEKSLLDNFRKSSTPVKDTHTWFSYLRKQGVQVLKLGVLNLSGDLPQHIASAFAGGSSWVLETDKRKCWRAKWRAKDQQHPQRKFWAVEYWEQSKMPVMTDFPDIETAYQDLEISITEAKIFSEKNKLGWENWFAEAIELLHNLAPVLPYHNDLLPPSNNNIRYRQLLAGATKAWVFGGMGSWNDIYFADAAQQKVYERISKSLYQAVCQSIGAVTNTKTG
ncbi:MAG: hypothetical protein EHM41_05265 [Chloroflexi bacterium]|nr:MAG: hypothetical protein EHM41_05265 [Chloroflexota bacterium]